jgi:hypothetical protein
MPSAHAALELLHHLVERQATGVDALRAHRADERAVDARLVEMVALLDGAQHRLVVGGPALRTHLLDAAAGADLGVGVQVEADRSVGEDHRALVASFGDEARMGATDDALRIHQRRTQRSLARDDAHHHVHVRIADALGQVAPAEEEARRPAAPVEDKAFLGNARGERGAVVGRHVLVDRHHRGSAVHGAGVEHLEPQALRKLPGNGTLPRPRRAVHRDDDAGRDGHSASSSTSSSSTGSITAANRSRARSMLPIGSVLAA